MNVDKHEDQISASPKEHHQSRNRLGKKGKDKDKDVANCIGAKLPVFESENNHFTWQACF